MVMNLARGGDVSTDRAGGKYPERAIGFLPGMLENADDLLAAVDPEMQLVAFNAAFRRALTEITGAPPQLEQKLGQLLADFPVVAVTLEANCQRACAGEALRISVEVPVEGNRRLFFDTRIDPVYGPEGRVHAVAVALRDITEQRATELRFQCILETAPDAMLAVHNGVIDFANSQLERMFGYAPGTLRGQALECLVPDRLRERHALHHSQYARNPKTRPMGSGLNLWGRKADGSEFAVEISLSPLEVAGEKRIVAAVRDMSARQRTEENLRNESGALRSQLAISERKRTEGEQRLVGINADMTEERRIRGELEDNKARLQGVLNSLKEGVVVFDHEGCVVDANSAALELLHFSAPEQIKRRVDEFAETFELFDLGGLLLSVDEWPLCRVLRGESFTDQELLLRRKNDGDTLVVSYNGTPIRDADGNVTLGVLSLVDITERKRAERALQEGERRLALALKASNTSVWEVDIATQKLLPAEDQLFAMLGYTREQLGTVADWIALIHEEDRPQITRMFDEIIQGTRDGYQGTELRYRKKDGSWCWILCQAMATDPDGQGKVTRLVGTHTDIQARKQAEESARKASLHDPLTALPNRALIYEYGNRLLAAAHRNHGRGAVLFVDLDRFKPINDQYGHEVGDRVLQEVAQRLKDCTREEDLVGRLGGDEFVIVLGHPDGHAHRASAVASHVLESLKRPIKVDALEMAISPSIGVSLFPEHADNLEGLIHAADLAMYQVKQSGRANYQIYTPELDRRADEIYTLEVRLREALKHGGLTLHYQPVIDARSGELISAEALVRLADNDGGEASGPATFIPIAESAGLIGDLGEWVAVEACRQHELWRRQGMPVTIAINVSPLQFRQRGFPERLGNIIAEAGIDPAALQVEVTETTVMESDDEARDILSRLKALGVKIALDDFGTGYSSLSRLSRLPLDKLKVDQSFVHGVDSDPASRAITEAIIALGHNLKLDIIGEGIESEQTLDYLEKHGCDQVQGFLFSKPLPASEFAQWHRQHHAPSV